MQVGVPVHEAGGELPDGRGGAAGGRTAVHEPGAITLVCDAGWSTGT